MNTTNQTEETPHELRQRAHAREWDAIEANQTELMRVSDLPEDQSFMLISDSQDIRATLESIGKLDELDSIGCMFVEVLDGDYGSVYAVERSIPYLSAIMWQLQ